MNVPTIRVWMSADGPKRFDEMTRDELLHVANELSAMLDDARESHQRTLRSWETCRRARAR